MDIERIEDFIVGLGFLASGIFMMVNRTYFAMGIVICLISIGILIFAGRIAE